MQAVGEGPVADVPRIVVLEDDPLLAKLLSQILSRAGFEVEVFETSDSLERRRKKSGAAVHLLLTERKLPGGASGSEVAREWQEREPGFPVVLIDRRQRGVSGRPDSDPDPGLPLLRPPFERGEIVRRIRELLGSSPSATPPAQGASSEAPSPEGPTLPH